jgi:hypothetical protein
MTMSTQVELIPVSPPRKSDPVSEYILAYFLIRCVLDEDEKAAVFEHIKPEWFEGLEMRGLYEVCLRVHEAGEQVNLATVRTAALPELTAVLCKLGGDDIDYTDYSILEQLGFPDVVSPEIDFDVIDHLDVPMNSAAARVIVRNMAQEAAENPDLANFPAAAGYTALRPLKPPPHPSDDYVLLQRILRYGIRDREERKAVYNQITADMLTDLFIAQLYDTCRELEAAGTVADLSAIHHLFPEETAHPCIRSILDSIIIDDRRYDDRDVFELFGVKIERESIDSRCDVYMKRADATLKKFRK